MSENLASDDAFWQLIERGKSDPERFRTVLGELTREGLIDFRAQFLIKSLDLITEEFENELDEYSEDGREEVAEWVVSQGKAFYEQVRANPRKGLPRECFELDDMFTESSFTGLVENEFYERYGEEITKYQQ
jgi:hypothetical protein